MKQIYILSSADTQTNLEILNKFVGDLDKRLSGNASVVSASYEDVGWYLDDNPSVNLLTGSELISQADLVWYKSYIRNEERAVAIAHILNKLDRKFVSSELLSSVSTGKLTQYARLWAAGLPMPKTAYIPMKHLADRYAELQRRLGTKELIIKAADGKGGDDNYLVKSLAQVKDIAKKHAGHDFVIQQFIPNDADYRVLVVGGKVKMIIERRRSSTGTHLNNTSQGATAQLIDPQDMRPEHLALSLRAAEVMKREVAGVDLMLHAETKDPFIIEVNAGPQVGSGAYTDEKLDVFAEYLSKV
jgi:glutathione synthase/RimK-type ligase-like ATP-grasp enzyme